MAGAYKYYAFISYSHQDLQWGKRLERKLAGYKMPATLCSERGWERKPINPIFFAPYDIQPGDLNEEIKSRLRASRNLIVICSPDSAQSEWVGKEIQYFHELGRDNNIFFFIVRGEPNSKDKSQECFNSVVHQLNIPEILGANIHERIYSLPFLNRERAYVQLISKLLNVEFDSIWNRHKRLLIREITLYLLLFVLFCFSLGIIRNIYKDEIIEIRTEEILPDNSKLPHLRDIVVSLFVGNECKKDTLHSPVEHIYFNHVPHRYLNQPIRLTITHSDFTPSFYEIDTTLILQKCNIISIVRDTNEYGNIELRIINKKSHKPMINIMTIVGNDTLYTNNQGWLVHHVPYHAQSDYYILSVPQYNITDTIYMPSQEHGIILL